MRVYYDRDADVNLIKAQEGRHRRLRQPGPCPCINLRDSGVKDVVVGAAPRLGRRQKAEAAGFKVMAPAEAAKWADVVMVLTPGRAPGRPLPRRSRAQHEATARRSPSPTA